MENVPDPYRHLNDITDAKARASDGVVLGIETIAEQVERLNYGMVRMVAALARSRLKRKPDDRFALALCDLIRSGMY